MKFVAKYTPIHTGVSIVGKEAYKDYRLTSKIRDPKKFTYYTDYRRIVRKIWNKVAEASMEYESGVYAKDFFYFIPQVVDNQPFVELYGGKIKTNSHTNGDIYSPIFCNLFKRFNHSCWSLDGTYTKSYKEKLKNTINKFVPKYYFILPILLNNKL
mgnify:CR=1 FL=1